MRKSNFWGLLFVLPFIIGTAVFFVFPVLFSGYISFTDWDMFNPPKFVGLKNWINSFKDPAFWISFRNVLYFAAIFVPLQTIFALVIANMLNQKIKFKGGFRACYFLPNVTPWVAGAIVWKFLYGYDYGLINYILRSLGFEGSYWYDSDKWWVAIGSLALMNVWKGMGQTMVILLSAMQSVPKEIVEAATTEGAGKAAIFRKITVPMISPMVFLTMILSTISAFTAFDVFLTMFDVYSLPDRNNVVNLMVYREAFIYGKMGPASTLAWMLFIIILIITVIQRKFEKKWVHYEN
ncbi:sugar ABC transporter permease [Blautia liquoris]|uniref:Sugar ABC transporter permease n=2 Tax=Blautia liquoris TaxID=2779518 RepID=A0A7M2RLI0_9FIRM|nr:sugar ABC transporter permease [Blautia liquoris]